ncbi:hypothetical protein ZWY2020_019727 [Hordeum vulgare]|nr:hypothetical protein ZWY2020_019727 [Hordeum vulgare]
MGACVRALLGRPRLGSRSPRGGGQRDRDVDAAHHHQPVPLHGVAGGRPGRPRHRLHPGANWSVDESAFDSPASIWGRTGCSFDAAGSGLCRTADCGSGLRCATTDPPAPVTRAQVASSEGFYHYGITTDKGFNLPLDLTCSSGDALRCREEGCHDAFPYVEFNEHACTAAGSRLQIVFCP